MIECIQLYDANLYNPRTYTPGHLFMSGLDVSLCGFRFGTRAEPSYDSNQKKVCRKCQAIKEKQNE